MCKRTMYKRARIPMFLWERRACANSGAQAVFPRPRKNGLGTRLVSRYPRVSGRFCARGYISACATLKCVVVSLAFQVTSLGMVSPLVSATWVRQQMVNGLKKIRILDGEVY